MSEELTEVKLEEKTVEKSVMPGLNGGTLRRGNLGGKGGSGRPPNEVRLRSLEGYTKFLERCEKIAQESQIEANALRAGDIMGKYGLGEPTKLSNPEFATIVAECAVPYFEGRESEYREFVASITRRLGQ